MIVPKGRKRCVANAKFKIAIYFYFSQCIDAFVDELRWEEQDLAKCDKLRELKLTGDEWARVTLFLGLLSVRVHFYLHFNA